MGSIRTKLLGGFGVITLLAVFSAVITAIQLREIRKVQDRTSNVRIPAAIAVERLSRELVNGGFQYRNYILYGGDPELAEKYNTARKKAWDAVLEHAQTLKDLLGAEDQPLLRTSNAVTGPILSGAAVMEKISKGDVSHDVPRALLRQGDETGVLGRAMQQMSESLRLLLRQISDSAQTLASSASRLGEASTGTTDSVREMAERSNAVAAAAEEACTNTTSVASSMETASSNLTSVAAATTEMSATVEAIASDSEKARQVSEDAIAKAQTMSTVMNELGKAARDIGDDRRSGRKRAGHTERDRVPVHCNRRGIDQSVDTASAGRRRARASQHFRAGGSGRATARHGRQIQGLATVAWPQPAESRRRKVTREGGQQTAAWHRGDHKLSVPDVAWEMFQRQPMP